MILSGNMISVIGVPKNEFDSIEETDSGSMMLYRYELLKLFDAIVVILFPILISDTGIL